MQWQQLYRGRLLGKCTEELGVDQVNDIHFTRNIHGLCFAADLCCFTESRACHVDGKLSGDWDSAAAEVRLAFAPDDDTADVFKGRCCAIWSTGADHFSGLLKNVGGIGTAESTVSGDGKNANPLDGYTLFKERVCNGCASCICK